MLTTRGMGVKVNISLLPSVQSNWIQSEMKCMADTLREASFAGKPHDESNTIFEINLMRSSSFNAHHTSFN